MSIKMQNSNKMNTQCIVRLTQDTGAFCQYQCKRLPGKTRLRNDLLCVKLNSLTHSHRCITCNSQLFTWEWNGESVWPVETSADKSFTSWVDHWWTINTRTCRTPVGPVQHSIQTYHRLSKSDRFTFHSNVSTTQTQVQVPKPHVQVQIQVQVQVPKYKYKYPSHKYKYKYLICTASTSNMQVPTDTSTQSTNWSNVVHLLTSSYFQTALLNWMDTGTKS